MDPVLLAAHIAPAPHSRILDAGCGCGIISILLASRHGDVRIFGVEIQRELACLARENVRINGIQDRVSILHRDIASLACTELLCEDPDRECLDGKVDVVIANPPYQKRGSGRISRDKQIALARHEISMDIAMLCTRAGELTGPKGAMAIIFPVDRFDELTMAMASAGFGVDQIRWVYTVQGREPKLVMVSGRKSMDQEPEILPHLHIFDATGKPSAEYNDILFFGRAWHNIFTGPSMGKPTAGNPPPVYPQ